MLARPQLLVSKLRPAAARQVHVPARLEEALRPRLGSLTLVHASAGYGKTTALAASHEPGWTWYSLDATDRDPAAFAPRLSQALGLEAPTGPASVPAEVLALDLAHQLQGRPATITLDRCEQVGDAVELGRFLGELLALAPGVALRVATRTRPSLPLERLRLDGRLLEAGPAELRLARGEIAEVLAGAWERPPRPAELEFADQVLGGWPAALHLWLRTLGDDGDLLAPLQPGQPLHEYLSEEVVGTLPVEVRDLVRRDWRWLVGRGPLLKRATNAGRRLVADRFVRDRVGVVPGRHGWYLHPLMAAFAAAHAAHGGGWAAADRRPALESAAPPPAAPAPPPTRLTIRTFGGLRVLVDGEPVPDAVWPASARRLLELILSVPGCRVTAPEAAQALWPQHPPRSARNSFNVALHGLRRALEPELTDGARSRYVVREGGLYRLRLDRLTCDAEDFAQLVQHVATPLDEEGAQRLQAAAELHAGDFLASCAEPFAQSRRDHLRGLLQTSLERLERWYAGAGELASAG